MPSMLPLLTEDESTILARNASALLHLHAAFAQTLLRCVAQVGLELRNSHYRPGLQAGKLEKAVGAVCEQFIEKVRILPIAPLFGYLLNAVLIKISVTCFVLPQAPQHCPPELQHSPLEPRHCPYQHSLPYRRC